jgi:hypothetical protein
MKYRYFIREHSSKLIFMAAFLVFILMVMLGAIAGG